ncbi:MAG: bifunctional phosphoribosylaminoimidazolecarboxamide formyltransferase/IMP cyclohydrolase [Planctomycetota bacterium]
MPRIVRALLSVTDKSGLEEFARALVDRYQVELLSTGGTARLLREKGIRVTEVSEFTGAPEILDGRVKTLHPKVHGGILARRDLAEHQRQMQENGIRPIDLVVVNLYRFEETIASPTVTFDEAIENIDIGGPAMVRAAAKNHAFVGIVTSPFQYPGVLAEMGRNGGDLSAAFRRELALAAWRTTARYDAAISSWLAAQDDEGDFPVAMPLWLDRAHELRYGENPHQEAALYLAGGGGIAGAEVLGGKELSYNNLLDLDAAWGCAWEFERPTVVIVKHNNPCGVGSGETLGEAWEKALAGDRVSAFGGVVAVNRPLDAETAGRMARPDQFLEALVVPGLVDEARKVLQTKPKWGKNLRLLRAGRPGAAEASRRAFQLRSISGGVLVQTEDAQLYDPGKLQMATTAPTDDQMRDLLFAWRVAKHVKSNAIVLAKDEAVVGVGAGQMSRLDSSYIAVRKAGERARGSVLASDAFFPFPDALEAALDAGVVAAIQPGGSMRDDEVIDLARRRGIPLVLTGFRHFRH